MKLSSRSFELQKSAVGSVRPINRTASYNRMLIVSYTTITDGNLNLYANGRQNVNLYNNNVYSDNLHLFVLYAGEHQPYNTCNSANSS